MGCDNTIEHESVAALHSQDGVLVQNLFLGKRGVEAFIFQTCRYMEYWDGNRSWLDLEKYDTKSAH